MAAYLSERGKGAGMGRTGCRPSFGAAVIGRVLEAEGLKVAIVPQLNWTDDLCDSKKPGQPRLFFAIFFLLIILLVK